MGPIVHRQEHKMLPLWYSLGAKVSRPDEFDPKRYGTTWRCEAKREELPCFEMRPSIALTLAYCTSVKLIALPD